METSKYELQRSKNKAKYRTLNCFSELSEALREFERTPINAKESVRVINCDTNAVVERKTTLPRRDA